MCAFLYGMIFVCSFVLFCFQVFKNTVSIFVNGSTNEYLPGSTVTVHEQISDANGTFTMAQNADGKCVCACVCVCVCVCVLSLIHI